MPSDVSIRPANYEDLPAIHRLVAALAEYEKALPSFTASIEAYREAFTEDVFRAHVAETAGGTIVGMIIHYLTYSTWRGRMLYLEDFVVQEEYRGRGVGQLLFAEFLAEACRRKCTMVKWQVLDWNEPAIRFYEQQGATIEKEWWSAKIIF